MIEKDIALIWDNLCFDRKKLKTISGLTVEIYSQGVYNYTMGIDFVDAFIKVGNNFFQGGIEIHKKTSDWYKHKHYKKAGYNNTILHVVYEHDLKEKMSDTLDNSDANIVELSSFIVQPNCELKNFNVTLRPCFEKYSFLSDDEKKAVLCEAGKARLRFFIEQMEGLLERGDADKVLFTALAEAIGYGKNKNVMKKLASLIPLELVDEFIYGGNADIVNERIEAFLFWKSGLMEKIKLNEELYKNYKKHEKSFYMWDNLVSESIRFEEWEFGAVRPYNSPYRNVAALASLYSKYLKQSLVAEIIEEYDKSRALIKTVENILNSKVYSLWQFVNTPSGRLSDVKRNFFTSNRINVIAANIIIPFLIIYCKEKRYYELAELLLKDYESLHGESFNRKTRFVYEQMSFVKSKFLKSICFMQGLLHLYKNFGEI